jgi:hypothetical protein
MISKVKNFAILDTATKQTGLEFYRMYETNQSCCEFQSRLNVPLLVFRSIRDTSELRD